MSFQNFSIILHIYLFVLTGFFHLQEQPFLLRRKTDTYYQNLTFFLILNGLKCVVKYLFTDRKRNFTDPAHLR